MEDITDYLINREDSIEYKTTDKNVANIEQDKLNKFIEGYKEIRKQAFIIERIDKNYFFNFVDILLKNYEEQKRVKEKYKQLYLEKLDKTTGVVLDYNKLLEKVKIVDKIQELKENIHNVLDKNGITRAYQIAIDQQFEKILKESENKDE